ncbi:MAG: hypothetical protein IJR42_01085 [Paludibacteraceae bacterium]|nr:hypothetical protein [Paludibacteraceae bacterium]
MKKKYSLLNCILGICLCLSSCDILGSNDPDNSGNSSYKQVRELSIDVLSEEFHSDYPYVRMMAESEGWVLLELKDDKLQHNSRAFAFMHEEEQIGYYLYALDSMVVMSQFTEDPMDNILENNVLVTMFYDEYIRCCVVRKIWEDQEILSEIVIPRSTKAKKMQRKDNYDVSVYNDISDHFKYGATELNNKTSPLNWIQSSKSNAVNAATMWTTFAFAASLHQIYSGNPDLQDQLEERIKQDDRTFIDLILRSYTAYDLASTVYHKIIDWTAIGKQWLADGKIEDATEDEHHPTRIYPISYTAHQFEFHYAEMREYLNAHPDCSALLEKEEVTENSARLFVTVSDLIGNDDLGWLEKKLKYTNTTTGETKEQSFYDMSAHVTLNGLTSLTEYNCWAEVISSGKTYKSNAVTFITKGDLHMEPSSLTFKASGGSRGAALLIDRDLLLGFDLNVPKWITKVDKAASSFFLDAGPNTSKERIVDVLRVSAYLKDGNTIYTTMPIIQEAPAENQWNNTKWKICGSVDIKDKGWYWNEDRTTHPEFILTIKNVDKNDFTIEIIKTVDSQESISYVGHYEGLSDDTKYAKIIIDNEGRLVYTYEYKNPSYYNLTRSELFVLNRVDEDNCEGDYQYENHWSHYGPDMMGDNVNQYGDLICNGKLTGTRTE